MVCRTREEADGRERGMRRRWGAWLSGALVLGLVLGSVLLVGVPSARAGSATYSGTVADSAGLATGCSSGTAFPHPYHAQAFTVTIGGSYDLLNVSNAFNNAD